MHNEEWKSQATNTILDWATGLDRLDGNSYGIVSFEIKLYNSLFHSVLLKLKSRPFMIFCISIKQFTLSYWNFKNGYTLSQLYMYMWSITMVILKYLLGTYRC